MKCPDCSGSGTIQLFTSTKPCAKCGGTGTVVDPIRGEGAWIARDKSETMHETTICVIPDVWTSLVGTGSDGVGVGADKDYAPNLVGSMFPLADATFLMRWPEWPRPSEPPL